MSWWLIIPALMIGGLTGAALLEARLKKGKHRPLAAQKPSARDVNFDRHRGATVVSDFATGRQLFRTPDHLKNRMMMEDKEALERKRLQAQRTSKDQLEEKRNRIRPWDNT